MSDSKKPALTSEEIREIVQILESSAFTSLELEIGDFRLRLRRGPDAGTPAGVAADAGGDASVGTSPAAKAPAAPVAQRAAANGAHPAPAVPAQAGTVEIRAPTLGRFYRAPRPGAAPFVDVGTPVTVQTTVGIIEVMKLMNGVLAGVEGEVSEICAEDGAAVEYDQVLMRVARHQA